ncbi:MAG: hypothetical protein J7K62_02525, partial [Thermoplasmata archaeon]|nr:hypothetical protein [Thermoplasmata archaeon]
MIIVSEYKDVYKLVTEGFEEAKRKMDILAKDLDMLGRKQLKFASTSRLATMSSHQLATGLKTGALTVNDLRKGFMEGTVSQTRFTRAMKEAAPAMTKLGKATEEYRKRAKGAEGVTGKLQLGLMQTITTGALMSVAWQAINGVLITGRKLITDLVWSYTELETSLKSIEVVSRATGRNYAEVMALMEKHTDAFMTRTALAPGLMKMLSTSLSVDEMDKFIQAVKDGSAAMGYQASEQLPLITRGFKQLTANILDNIGVTVYLNKIRREASKELGISVDALTEAQIHHQLFNEMIKQTSKYTGLYEAQMDTAKGALERLGAEWVKFSEVVSKANTGPITRFLNLMSDVISSIRESTEIGEAIEKYRFEFGPNAESIGGLERYMKLLKEGKSPLRAFGEEFIYEVKELLTGSKNIKAAQEAHEKYMMGLKYSHSEVVEAINKYIPILAEQEKLLRSGALTEEYANKITEDRAKIIAKLSDILKGGGVASENYTKTIEDMIN